MEITKDKYITDQVGDQAADQVEKLLNIIGDEILSSVEIMERLGMKHKPTFRQNYLNPAIKMGKVEMIIKDKPKSSKQKYRRVL